MHPWVAITVGTLAAALMVASLRVSILRLRYQLSAAVTEETELLASQREITVELRELRDPTRLRELATKQGFARPERVIQLSVPATGASRNRTMRSADLGRSGLRLRVACAVLLGCFALLAVRAAQLAMVDPPRSGAGQDDRTRGPFAWRPPEG